MLNSTCLGNELMLMMKMEEHFKQRPLLFLFAHYYLVQVYENALYLG